MKNKVNILISGLIILVLGNFIFYYTSLKTHYSTKLKQEFRSLMEVQQDDKWNIQTIHDQIQISYEAREYYVTISDTFFYGDFNNNDEIDRTALALFLQAFQQMQGKMNDNFLKYLNTEYSFYDTSNGIEIIENQSILHVKVNYSIEILPYDHLKNLFPEKILQDFIERTLYIDGDNMLIDNDNLLFIYQKSEKSYYYVAEKYSRTSLSDETIASFLEKTVGIAIADDFRRDYISLNIVEEEQYEILEMPRDFYINDFRDEIEKKDPEEYIYTRIILKI